MFCVSNAGFGPQFITNARRKSVEIPAKREIDVDLDKGTAQFIRKTELRNGRLRIKGLDSESKALLDEVGASKNKDEPPQQARSVQETPVQQLLARMPTISIQQFRAEAKDLLGADWPVGQVPNREGIVNLLKLHDEKGNSNDND